MLSCVPSCLPTSISPSQDTLPEGSVARLSLSLSLSRAWRDLSSTTYQTNTSSGKGPTRVRVKECGSVRRLSKENAPKFQQTLTQESASPASLTRERERERDLERESCFRAGSLLSGAGSTQSVSHTRSTVHSLSNENNAPVRCEMARCVRRPR